MRRFAVLSDLHLHPWSYGSTIINGRNSRLLDQVNLLARILTYLKEQDIKELIFTGDFLHTHSIVRSEVLWAAHFFLSQLKAEKIVPLFLVGNHDYAGKAGDLHSLDFFKEFGQVVEDPGQYHNLFWAMSYTEDENKLRGFLDKTPNNSIILLHQGLSQIPVNSKGFTINEILHPDMIPTNAAGAFIGHYHSRFRIKDRNIWSPGSPMQLNWSDAGEERGILDVTCSSERPIQVREVTFDSPQFVELDGNEPEEKIFQNAENNFIRVRTTNIELKEKILKHGARSCELVNPSSNDETPRLETNDKHFDNLSGIVSSYMEHKKLDIDTRRVGEQLIEGTYKCV